MPRDLDELLGIEGTAARLYFGAFAGHVQGRRRRRATREFSFDFTHRNRRPPPDPVNALLSFAYSLLAKDLTIICHAVGFDPFVGFFHQPRFGRPALALDLLEEFRPLIADSAVLSAINTRMVTPGDFIRVGSAVSLKPSGRKAFIRAYEQRMDTLVTHPLFGYRVNYRRVLEIQVRLAGPGASKERRRVIEVLKRVEHFERRSEGEKAGIARNGKKYCDIYVFRAERTGGTRRRQAEMAGRSQSGHLFFEN